MASSSSPASGATSPAPSHPPLFGNPAEAGWIVQKYGGTSVGKFLDAITGNIIPSYLNQNRVVVVCSARSGTTKSNGTTNLLLKAAAEARAPAPVPFTPGTPRDNTAAGGSLSRNPSGFFGGSNQFASSSTPPSVAFQRQPSLPGHLRQPGTSRSGSPSPFVALSSCNSLASSVSSLPETPAAPVEASFHATVDQIKSDHFAAAREAIKDEELLEELLYEIERDCEGLRGFLFAAQIIDEISERSKDSIIGIGERLSCKIVAAALRDKGVDSELVSFENIVQATLSGEDGDDLEDEVEPGEEFNLGQDFYDRVARKMGERLKECGSRVPVVTGYFGVVPGSLLKQVGRGYTDLCAALCAVGLEATELQIWKEVDGIFSADPRKVPTARLIPIITPDEAAELTYYGSEVIHPFTMEQVIRASIPIRIKNVENPLGGGTVIYPQSDTPVLDPESGELAVNQRPVKRFPQHLPTAVTIKDEIVIINIHSNRKTLSHGFLAKIFGTLDRFGVIVDLISTSEVHVSMAIHASLVRKEIEKMVKELKKIGTVTVLTDMVILSLVGRLQNMVGISGRMFTTLAEGSINIEMISQGASEINISCVIEGKDAIKALNLVHRSCLSIPPAAV
ncbi:Aspartate/glutamate/uridylate kinase [Mrakia frigida]|uniref:aspartate kinase n=1 Tax=Mrakia frigida TaxID=29902 RepID=UPI003FCC2449